MSLIGCIYLTSLILLLISHEATAKVNYNDLSMNDVEEAIDAYMRKDYIYLGIKLIEIKFSIDPPEQYSTEQLQLLILRYVLVKIHPYYLSWFPSKRPTENSSSINETETPTIFKFFNESLSLLDYGTHQISGGINNLLSLGSTVIKNMAQIPQPNTMEGKSEDHKRENSTDSNLEASEEVTANPHTQKENLGHGGSNLLSDSVNFLTNAAILTAGEVMAALIPHDDFVSHKKNEKSKSKDDMADVLDSEYDQNKTDQSSKLNRSDAKENNGPKVNKPVKNIGKVQEKSSASENKTTKINNNTSSTRSDNEINRKKRIESSKATNTSMSAAAAAAAGNNKEKPSTCTGTTCKEQIGNKTNTKNKSSKAINSNSNKKQNNSIANKN